MNEISKTAAEAKAKLVVRNAAIKDAEAICALSIKVYKDVPAYSVDMIRGQIANFPEGQFVALYDDAVVGYCATFRVSSAIALKPHTWREITGGGFASRHDPDGDVLYGMEVCVDPDYRGSRIGQRLYNERKKLCVELRLMGIVFAGRLPALARRIKKVRTAENYIDLVKAGKLRDQVLSFQLRNDFEILGLLKDYLPSDHESLGYATHMIWRNPHAKVDVKAGVKVQRGRHPDSVRVAAVNYQQRRVSSFAEFARNIEYFVDVVADYKADFVLFPELFTLQLLSIENKPVPAADAIAALTKYTESLKELLSNLAVDYNINIIGGSHPTYVGDEVLNICYVCLRDGSIHQQPKIHPTPNERYWWNIQGGSTVHAIMTDCGPIGVNICYDCEFPELPRHLANQGMQILFVPFCTDERQSYLRVRYCAASRAIENQCYVVMSGNVGNLPGVENMDIQYAQSCILTPCDFPFARDGIAADTTPNVETVAIADLRLDNLQNARNTGTVQNLKDRRFDLYSIAWRGRVG